MTMRVCSLQIISRLDSRRKFYRCLHHFLAAKLVSRRRYTFMAAPHTGPYKFVQNISTNILGSGKRKDWEKCVNYRSPNITIS